MLKELIDYTENIKASTEGPIVVGEISTSYPNHKKLTSWLKKQRNNYRHSITLLTEERINALDEINFAWNVHDVKWEHNFSLLQEYWNKNKHTYDVKRNIKLNTWTKTLRSKNRTRTKVI
mmetsp:Transcript_5595/g.6384  ORF Transcript_5595/g.6384 Transcript_5595/m.6384 type:complete len:120 (-) Transcript_5595:45-404(-)